MRRPAANLFRFSPDYAQRRRGSGRTRTTNSAGDEPPSSPTTRIRGGRVLRPSRPSSARSGGTRSHDRLRRHPGPGRARAGHAARRHRHVRRTTSTPRRSSARSRRNSTTLAACWCRAPNLEDPQLMQTLGRKLDGVVGSTWLPSSPPSPVLRDYRRRWRAAFPGLPAAFANHSAVIGYYNALEETVSALGRIRSADVRGRVDGRAPSRSPRSSRRFGHRSTGTGKRFATGTSRGSSTVEASSRSSRSGSCRTSSRASRACSPLLRRPVPAPSRARGRRRLPGRARRRVSRRSSR